MLKNETPLYSRRDSGFTRNSGLYSECTRESRSSAKHFIRHCQISSKLKEQPYMGVVLRKKLNREIDGYCLITGKYIVIYEVDSVVSVLRVLDTRMDYLRVLLKD